MHSQQDRPPKLMKDSIVSQSYPELFVCLIYFLRHIWCVNCYVVITYCYSSFIYLWIEIWAVNLDLHRGVLFWKYFCFDSGLIYEAWINAYLKVITVPGLNKSDPQFIVKIRMIYLDADWPWYIRIVFYSKGIKLGNPWIIS